MFRKKVEKFPDGVAERRHEDTDFYNEIVTKIPGWLEEATAFRTFDILRWQEEGGVKGPIFEIGVFAGRYFSILARSAARNGNPILGLDTFQYVTRPAVHHHLESIKHLGADIRFVEGFSTSYGAAELLALMDGGRPRFISIDGSHERDDVFWDLRLAEDLLAQKGVVAVDDFINPLTLGVNDAVNAFFAFPRNLAPFAYIRNKLFLCRPSHAGAATAFVESALMKAQDATSEKWRQDAAADRNRVEARMWGKSFLIVC
ncbi:hypothetical protein Amn_49610 [Aminobacter sp. Y103A]|uniref:class I SAM-dependent methyltransferase n=1 Tax=Aminobacter sp. Y103A TaxID=1870862 RepID=UPI002573B0BF|nr:class I SAM-dependent methyltransferase [Aminobacter sp. SS-2016]BBD40081.1 hypothetical protein Amn_49610 [Aminobacter sp. SS-2016]